MVSIVVPNRVGTRNSVAVSGDSSLSEGWRWTLYPETRCMNSFPNNTQSLTDESTENHAPAVVGEVSENFQSDLIQFSIRHRCHGRMHGAVTPVSTIILIDVFNLEGCMARSNESPSQLISMNGSGMKPKKSGDLRHAAIDLGEIAKKVIIDGSCQASTQSQSMMAKLSRNQSGRAGRTVG